MSNLDLSQATSSLSTHRLAFTVHSGSDGSTKVEAHTPEATEWLRIVLNRALNTWDEAPGEVKELGDLVIDGRPLQRYALK